jgi:hypothetical protein
MEWGPYIDDLELAAEQMGITPEPLKNKTDLYVHLMDVVEAVAFCESRGYQFSEKTPVAEIAAYYNTFSTFSGSAVSFLRFYRKVEKLRRSFRESKDND